MGIVVYGIDDEATHEVCLQGQPEGMPSLMAPVLRRLGALSFFGGDVAEEGSDEPSPLAVVLEDPNVDFPAGVSMLLGWDEGRRKVSDVWWDHLPVLGYLVPTSDGVVLHELMEGGVVPLFKPVTLARAQELGLVDDQGSWCRQGQPSLAACEEPVLEIAGEMLLYRGVLANGREVTFGVFGWPVGLEEAPAAQSFIGMPPRKATAALEDKKEEILSSRPGLPGGIL